ncbi:type III effector [Xanthomonas euvesicatoria]|uniref:type III effector n=1 Tax=Xanthomonas euvesicatoria TaxID=456327 RepID=UPI001C49299F|nr:type III effector [Xanthomonas euvesicatoria]MBV6799958.1 type III effector [Xanthomonas campestris pv. obscurae]
MKSFFRSVGSSSRSSASESQSSSEGEMLDAARETYKRSVLWHGTALDNLASIRRNGFSTRLKSAGATEGAKSTLGEPTEELADSARLHNYFTSSRDSAKKFAKFADSSNPAIVRTIGIRNNFDIELDPDTKNAQGEPSPYCARTTDSIPAKFVLGSKRSAPGDNAKIFKAEMKAAGYKVSTEQAGKLLREVQSDSDDDF